MRAPSYPVTDCRRDLQLRNEAKAAIRHAILTFIQQGWREGEIALALADAADDYCLYVATPRNRKFVAANVN